MTCLTGGSPRTATEPVSRSTSGTTRRTNIVTVDLVTIYRYRGDGFTAPALKGAICYPVRRGDGKCVRGRLGTMLVAFDGGAWHVVLGRQLRKLPA